MHAREPHVDGGLAPVRLDDSGSVARSWRSFSRRTVLAPRQSGGRRTSVVDREEVALDARERAGHEEHPAATPRTSCLVPVNPLIMRIGILPIPNSGMGRGIFHRLAGGHAAVAEQHTRHVDERAPVLDVRIELSMRAIVERICVPNGVASPVGTSEGGRREIPPSDLNDNRPAGAVCSVRSSHGEAPRSPVHEIRRNPDVAADQESNR